MIVLELKDLKADRRLDQVVLVDVEHGVMVRGEAEDAFRLGQDLEQQAAKALAAANGNGED